MFERILIPFDGSVGATAALDKGAALAVLTGAEATVLTVYRNHSMLEASVSMVRAADPEKMGDAMKTYARETAEAGKARLRAAGVERARAFIKTGQPARTIVGFAREHGYDLIVVGARGMGSVEGYLVGSVSHKVTGLAHCPVLVV